MNIFHSTFQQPILRVSTKKSTAFTHKHKIPIISNPNTEKKKNRQNKFPPNTDKHTDFSRSRPLLYANKQTTPDQHPMNIYKVSARDTRFPAPGPDINPSE